MSNIFAQFKLVPEIKKGYVSDLEKQYEIDLPPIFKSFCETFLIESLEATEKHDIYHPDEELGFDRFLFCLKEIINYFQEIGEPHETYGMMPIANSTIHSGGINICIKGENKDKIYINDEMCSEQFRIIAPNIFNFVSQIKMYNYSED